MSQPSAPAIPLFLRRRPVLQDLLTMAFYSPEKPDVIFDEDGDVLLTVGDQSEKRNFLIRSSLLRQHSSYFDDVLKVQSHDSKNPWRRSYKRADVLALFIILRGLHSNIWPKQVGLRLLVRLVGATWLFNFDRELPDGSAPLRTAAWGWLFSIRERLGLSDMVRRWTLMKAAYFFGNLAAFNRLSLELVRGHIGLFANLENAQAAILGLGVDFPTPMKVTPDSLILDRLAYIRSGFRTHLNDLYFGDVYDFLFDRGPFPQDHLLDIPAPPALIDIFAESDGSSTSSTYSVAQQCTCAWLPTYYNGWLELLDSRLPFPLKRTHSVDAAAVPFRRFLVESQGNGAVDMPWRDCPGYKEPDCEMGELDHNWAGKQLRRLLIGVLDYWEEDLKTEVEKYSKEIGVDGLWWVPWAPEEGEGVVESQNVPEE